MSEEKQTEYEILQRAQDAGRMDNEELDPPDIVPLTPSDEAYYDNL